MARFPGFLFLYLIYYCRPFQINIGQAEKTVELLLPIDITTVRIRFSPMNDDTGSRATEVWQ